MISIYTYFQFRITPACVGKTNWVGKLGGEIGWERVVFPTEDYPRVCGARPRQLFEIFEQLILPHAFGENFPTYLSGTSAGNHPRVCGKKHLLHLSTFLLEGFEHRYSNVDILIWRLCGKGNELPKYGVFTRCFERAVVLAQKAIRCHSEKV